MKLTSCILIMGATVCCLSIRADDDTLRDLGPAAAPGEIPKWDGAQWRNGHDNVTDIRPGYGLQGGMTNNTAFLSVTYPPVGSVVAWLKSYPNTPALPDGWVECNGQTLIDPESLYDGNMIPNLNGVIFPMDGTTTRSGFNTLPEGAFDMNDVTYAENQQSSSGEIYIGKLFSEQYIDSANITFTVNSYDNVYVYLQVYDGVAWSTLVQFDGDKSNEQVLINQRVQGIRFRMSQSSNSRTCRVYRLDVGARKAFLRGGGGISGGQGGAETHKHQVSIPGYQNEDPGTRYSADRGTYDTTYTAQLPPFYEVLWIMRVK